MSHVINMVFQDLHDESVESKSRINGGMFQSPMQILFKLYGEHFLHNRELT